MRISFRCSVRGQSSGGVHFSTIIFHQPKSTVSGRTGGGHDRRIRFRNRGADRFTGFVGAVAGLRYPLKVRRIDTLILGNPHYTLLSAVIQTKIGRRVRIVDSAAGVSARLRRYLTAHPELDRTLPKSGRIRLVFTDLTPQVEKGVDRILASSLPLESSTDIRRLPTKKREPPDLCGASLWEWTNIDGSKILAHCR